MLCISPHPGLRVNVRHERTLYTPKGDVAGKERKLYAQFQRGGGIPEWARREALDKLQFRGLPPDIAPGQVIGWFDTRMAQADEGWTDEERELVEEKLRAQAGGLYMVAEKPKAKVPWPTYHKVKKADAVAQFAADLGLVEEALAYERDRDKQRPDFIAALEKAAADLAEQEPDEELVEA